MLNRIPASLFSVQVTYFIVFKKKKRISLHKFSIDCEVSFKGQDGLLKIYFSVYDQLMDV